MRQLIGAGTPREAVAGGYGGIFVLLTPTGAMLVARGGVRKAASRLSPPHSSSGGESRKKPLNQRAGKVGIIQIDSMHIDQVIFFSCVDFSNGSKVNVLEVRSFIF